ncbi:centrosomal protein of 128 kDa [Chanos chanos]|uniref:Centrosomal protein of 128 kDa n=1 Tax=Chanos chanos TaxID=29144 RepID=A0A6J2V6F4_CHACN|nr:centrosomal protein of 128 kDa [Chanos chanos]
MWRVETSGQAKVVWRLQYNGLQNNIHAWSASTMESSSESDSYDRARGFSSRGRNGHLRGDRTRTDPGIAEKINKLANTLQDTSRNLHKVDRMLGQYREHTDDQAEAMAALRGNLEESIQQLQSQRLRRSAETRSASVSTLHTSDLDEGSTSDGRRYNPTSPLKDFERTGSRRRSRSASVRFRDSGKGEEQIHSLHQSLRDLRSDQIRLGDDMDREIHRRNRADIETRKTLESLTSHLRASQREDPVSLRVERRLQEIESEIRSERRAAPERSCPEQRSSMSAELQEALRRRDGQVLQNSNAIADRLLRSESEKSKVMLELERSRRQLDQSQSGQDVLLQQVEDMRAQLLRAEKERMELQREISELHSQRSRENMGGTGLRHSKNGWTVEQELQGLRAQQSQISILSEVDELRRTVERKEREKKQLTVQLEALSSDLERRERQQLRMLEQLKEIQALSEDGAAERARAEAQLADSDKKREELRARAQEAVRQWKAKCKRLERELQELRDESRLGSDKAKQASKERESVLSLQAEGARRELADVLGRLAQREEDVRRRDVELSETRARLLSAEQELRDARDASRALEEDAQRRGLLQAQLREEKSRLEERLEVSGRRRELDQAALLELQGSVKELSAERAELSGRLAKAGAADKELREKLASAQEEKASLSKQLELERDIHQRELSHLKASLQDSKAKQDWDVQETLRLYQQEREEMEARLRELKEDAVADKDLVRALRTKLEKMKNECDKLTDELSQSEESQSQLHRKYQALKKEVEVKMKLAERTEEQRRAAEESVEELQGRLAGLEAERESILNSLGAQIDSVCQALSKDSAAKLKAMSCSPGLQKDPHRWLAETKTKLQWICEEVSERDSREHRLRRQIQQSREQLKALKQSGDSEQQRLLDRISHQDQLLQDIHAQRKDLMERSRKKDDEMRNLQERIVDLEMSTRLALDHLESVPEKLSLLENFRDLEESQRQREVVEQRYSKYREIVGDLQHQLEESKRRIREYRDEKLDATSRSLHLAGLSSSLRGHSTLLSHSILSSDVCGYTNTATIS